MKTLFRAFALAFVATSCFAQDVARMDQVVESYVQAKTFMGSVLVAKGADIILSKGYGHANLEWDLPNTPSTKFRLGSITKQFTAASILLLEQRGKLTLDDPIKKYITDAPPTWDPITLFHLLTHTSGVPNFTSFPEYKTQELTDTPVTKTIALVRERPLDFAPGEKMSYSNSGYILLGYVIEKVSGGSYARFIQENIFTPLGMTDSGYDSNSAIISHRAAGYAPSPQGPVNAGYIHMSIPHAAGGLYSTTEDLLRWEQALFGGKVLSGASLRKMTTAFKDDYALGVFVRSTEGRTVVEHGGAIEGFNTFLAYYPDDKLAIAVLANLNGQAPNAIASKLATIARGGAVITNSERQEISVPRETLDKYTGTYDMAPGVHLWIRRENDHLTVQLTGQGQLPLFAESSTRFFLRAVDAQLDFVTDTNGAATAVVLHQNGRDMTARHTSQTIDGGPQHIEIAVPSSVLSKYVGMYQVRPNVNLIVTLEGDRLMAQMSEQPRAQIFPESTTLFFYKVVDATLQFQTDATGVATSVRLRQGPVNEVFSRR
jgi:CubicO group peptidase (beta-lactamase class C family)